MRFICKGHLLRFLLVFWLLVLSCNSFWFDANFFPGNTWHYLFCVNTVLELDSDIKHRVKKRVRKKMRLESQLDEFGVLCIVVMFFCLYSGVGHRYGLDINPKFCSCLCNKASKFVNRKLLRKLIEDPEFPLLCWIGDGKLNTLNCVSYV